MTAFGGKADISQTQRNVHFQRGNCATRGIRRLTARRHKIAACHFDLDQIQVARFLHPKRDEVESEGRSGKLHAKSAVASDCDWGGPHRVYCGDCDWTFAALGSGYSCIGHLSLGLRRRPLCETAALGLATHRLEHLIAQRRAILNGKSPVTQA